MWDTKTWKQLRQFDAGPTLKHGVQWSPDSKMLAWGSTADESAVRIWDRDTDKISALLGHSFSLRGIAWSHDGKYLATASTREPSARIWDADNLTTIAALQSPGAFGVSWSADDKFLALATSDSRRVIWDVALQQPVPDA